MHCQEVGASMELTLTRQEGTQAQVTCDNLPSHTFDIRSLIPNTLTSFN
jgi:hypothetical protein